MPEYTPKEALSKQVFGRQHAMKVWERVMELTVNPPEKFTVESLSNQLRDTEGIGRLAVFHEVHILHDIGMIARVEGDDPRSKPYVRVEEHPGWQLIDVLVKRVTRQE